MINGMLRFIRACRQLLRDTSPAIWGCIALVGLLSIWTQSIPAESELARHLASEDGFFEQASAAFLVAAALLAILSWIVGRARAWLATGVILVYAALRELDVQTMFTYRSIMSTGYYTGSKAALGEKILVILMILPCLVAIADLARLTWVRRDRWLASSRVASHSQASLRAWGIWMLLFFGTSHLADRHPSLLAWMPGRVGAWEALVEAGLCLLALLLVVELKPSLLKQPDS
jgi:hypothetical protein